jgi:hypothetical protein
MSIALITKYQKETLVEIKDLTELIEAAERSITTQVSVIAFLSGKRRELRDSLLDDDNLITALVDIPLLDGGTRVSIGEARRIIEELSHYIKDHSD